MFSLSSPKGTSPFPHSIHSPSSKNLDSPLKICFSYIGKWSQIELKIQTSRENSLLNSGVTRHLEMGGARVARNFFFFWAPVVVYYMFFQYHNFHMGGTWGGSCTWPIWEGTYLPCPPLVTPQQLNSTLKSCVEKQHACNVACNAYSSLKFSVETQHMQQCPSQNV